MPAFLKNVMIDSPVRLPRGLISSSLLGNREISQLGADLPRLIAARSRLSKQVQRRLQVGRAILLWLRKAARAHVHLDRGEKELGRLQGRVARRPHVDELMLAYSVVDLDVRRALVSDFGLP